MPEIFFTRHAKNRMRWRRISRETIEMIIENPEHVEDKGNQQYNYYKTIGGIHFKVFCAKEKDSFIILSAIKK